MDSNQFIKSSLSNLVFQYNDACKSSPISEQNCFLKKGLRMEFDIQSNSEVYNLLKSQKGNFPFNHIDCESKLLETIFPGKDSFYNDLRNQPISDKDYENSKKIYQLTNCVNLADYMRLYCMTDIYFLCDIFLKYRQIWFNDHGLDMAQYMTASSFFLDAFLYEKYLKDANFRIELYNDPELTNCINNNLRGGFCSLISHHENFFDVCSTFDNVSEESKQKLSEKIKDVFYFDINSCYAYAMSQNIPLGNFKRLSKTEMRILINNLKKNSIDFDKSPIGYFLEVTLAANDKKFKIMQINTL